MTALADLHASTPSHIDVDSHGAARGRDPAHELYEHAAGLLTTAHALEAATRDPGSVVAIAATLACWEASLAALAGATERLRRHALERLTDPVLAHETLRADRADVAFQLERLAGVLEQSAFASAKARDSLEPVLLELTAI